MVNDLPSEGWGLVRGCKRFQDVVLPADSSSKLRRYIIVSPFSHCKDGIILGIATHIRYATTKPSDIALRIFRGSLASPIT